MIRSRASRSRYAWPETAIVTLAAVGLGWLLQPRDPFCLATIPWLAVAPLWIGLEHGSRPAVASALALLVGAFCYHRAGDAVASFPLDYVVGVGLLGPLAGEYRDVWRRSLEHMSRQSAQRGEQLGTFTRAYHLLKRSHDDLEQRIATRGASLHARLDDVEALIEHSASQPLDRAGDRVLELFSHFAQVQVASLHRVREPSPDAGRDATPAVDPDPVAALGACQAIDFGHPMVVDAVATGELTSVRDERVSARGRSPLACVPLTCARGRLRGVVMIHEMPFMALHIDNLTFLVALAGRIGDWLAAADQPGARGVSGLPASAQ